MSDFSLEIDELRAIIEGRRSYRKCPACLGRGYEWFCADKGVVFADQDGDDESYYEDKYGSEYVDKDGCDTCYGLGYVVAVYE